MNLDQEIFHRYFEGAKRDGMIWTITDYALQKGFIKDEGQDPDIHPEISEHGGVIKDVLTLEIALYVFRRLNGPWGEVIDALASQRRRKINEYREQTGFEIDTGNEDRMY